MAVTVVTDILIIFNITGIIGCALFRVALQRATLHITSRTPNTPCDLHLTSSSSCALACCWLKTFGDEGAVNVATL